jgi:hypothetical protein
MVQAIVRRDTSPHILRLLSKLPWTALIIIFLVVTTVAEMQMEGPLGYVFIGFGLFVLFVEFFKSGDISTTAFLADLVIAIASVIAATALITVMLIDQRYDLTFFHWYGAAIVIADAVLSPFNSFRTAKRNLELGGVSAG